eukprot:1902413-Prorocentrum_lima.AAC.1
MTSSLVGSEMCIRDREKGVGTHAHMVERHHAVLRQAFLKSRASAEAEGSVSYTHLTLPTICSV